MDTLVFGPPTHTTHNHQHYKQAPSTPAPTPPPTSTSHPTTTTMKQGTTLLLLLAFAVVAAAVVPSVRASGNGCLYKCDISVGQPCVFEAALQSEVDECTTRIGVASMTAISTIAQHSLASGCAPEDAASFGTQQCNAFSSSSVPDGTCGTTPKAATPQPLTNGDCVKTTAAAVSPDTHNWAAIQSYGMALRNKVGGGVVCVWRISWVFFCLTWFALPADHV